MKQIKYRKIDRIIVLINMAMAIIYFSWWLNPSHVGNIWLYALLVGSEVYHLMMAMSFWQTMYPYKKEVTIKNFHHFPMVDIFITVCGEPVEVVRQTAIAALHQDYPNHRVFILNDGNVAKKENWMEIEEMAQEVGVGCITREIPGGAKAGNVNNGLKQTQGELVAVLDADMVPKRNFLRELAPFFGDPKVGFVQSPQFYKNYEENEITRGAWEQQELFFGAIMKGKESSNAAFICGTNFLARRSAFDEVGGFKEDNIAEDFLTSIFIHRNGWKSKYVNKVLCEGLAPEDALAYYKQQLRWARGSLEAFFTYNPLLIKELTWKQKVQYLSSMLFYFNGVVVLIDIVMPLLYLYGKIEPVVATSTSFALFFLPFMMLNLYTLNRTSRGRITFRAMGFTQSSFGIHIQALVSILLGQKMSFAVTPKQKQEGNFLFLAYPHILYILLTIGGSILATYRWGFDSSTATNMAWAGLNCVMFVPFISGTYRWSKLTSLIGTREKAPIEEVALEE